MKQKMGCYETLLAHAATILILCQFKPDVFSRSDVKFFKNYNVFRLLRYRITYKSLVQASRGNGHMYN